MSSQNLLMVNRCLRATVHDAINKRLDAVEGTQTISVGVIGVISVWLNLLSELVQNEDRFNTVRDALKGMHKLDLDKLICSVSSCQISWLHSSPLTLNNYSWLPRKLNRQAAQKLSRNE